MFWPGTWAGVARGHGLTSIDYASQSLHICLSSTAAINWYRIHNYTTPPYHCHGHLLAPKVCLRVRIGRPSIDWLYFNYFTETRGKDTMDKKWLQLSIGSKSKADVLDVATLVSTRGREDLSVCLRSSPACVCTAPRVLGLLLINLVHYLFRCAGLRGHQPLCGDCRGETNVGCSDIRLRLLRAAGMFMSSLIPRPPHHQPTTCAFHNNLILLQYRGCLCRSIPVTLDELYLALHVPIVQMI